MVSDIFYEASFEFQSEMNWNLLRDSMPGILKLLEGLSSITPNDEKLLISLIKGYAGYGFAIWETKALEDIFLEREQSTHLKKALEYYSRAVNYGFDFLKLRDISSQELLTSLNKKEGITEVFKGKLDNKKREDKEAVLYFAQSLGGLIHFQKHQISLVAQLPLVKEMFDWVCSPDPDFNYGICDIFYGSYESGIPKMLGGNPEKGKKIFENVIKRHQHNWLARVAYIQYYAIPMADEKVYREQKAVLTKALDLMEKEKYWIPNKKQQSAFKERHLRTFQAIAVKRFAIIKKYEKDIF